MKTKILSLLAVALFATSCGVSSHMVGNSNVTATQVQLTQANFDVVKSVEGEAKATYVLGIGGFSKKALSANAVAEMNKNAELEGSQVIINQTVDDKIYGVFPFFFTIKKTSHGQVIEFKK